MLGGGAERCLTILGGLMAGGFKPGLLIDSNPDLQGRYAATMKQPVLHPEQCNSAIDEVLILSVQYAQEIVAANRNIFSPDSLVHIPTKGSFRLKQLI